MLAERLKPLGQFHFKVKQMKKTFILALFLCAFVASAGAQSLLTDAMDNPSIKPQYQTFPFFWNGATWDRAPGNATLGLFTNMKGWGGTAVLTGGVAGSVGIGGLAGNDVAVAGNPLRLAGFSWTDGTAPTPTTAGRTTDLLTTTDHRLVVTQDHPKRVACVLTTTATTSTAITGCAAPGAGLSIYITDISVYGGAALGATAAATIQSGTGGTCGSNTTIHHYCQHPATAGCEAHFVVPKKGFANGELCLLDATTGTKFVTISGYVAP